MTAMGCEEEKIWIIMSMLSSRVVLASLPDRISDESSQVAGEGLK